MNILVIFGSASDKDIYEPFIDLLKKESYVEFDIISAHRNPEELDKMLNGTKVDAIVGGAGLAAHLPGVIASKVNCPVFGIPVAANFSGIDALLSIVQMPFGIPVLTSAPDRYQDVCKFIGLWKKCGKEQMKRMKTINILASETMRKRKSFIKEFERSQEVTAKNKFELKLVSEIVSDGYINIIPVCSPDDVRNDAFAIHVPLFDEMEKTQLASAVKLFDMVSRGGIWIGTNNMRNAILACQKLGGVS